MIALILFPRLSLPVAMQATALVVLLFVVALALSAIGGRLLGWLIDLLPTSEEFFEENAPTHHVIEYDRAKGIDVKRPVFRAPPLPDTPPAKPEDLRQ